ncbi:unnamed protein product, partial [marine sediment metagenome]
LNIPAGTARFNFNSLMAHRRNLTKAFSIIYPRPVLEAYSVTPNIDNLVGMTENIETIHGGSEAP